LVAEALLWTLQQDLGDTFTDDVARAWAAVYTLMTDIMKASASEVAAGIRVSRISEAGARCF
jgi:hemoglobin-like flavoprotein